MTNAGPGRVVHDRSDKDWSSSRPGESASSSRGTAIMGGRPRSRYQLTTASSALSNGSPGSPSGSAELARPVNPSAARSSHPPSHSSSVPRQCLAATRSRSMIWSYTHAMMPCFGSNPHHIYTRVPPSTQWRLSPDVDLVWNHDPVYFGALHDPNYRHTIVSDHRDCMFGLKCQADGRAALTVNRSVFSAEKSPCTCRDVRASVGSMRGNGGATRWGFGGWSHDGRGVLATFVSMATSRSRGSAGSRSGRARAVDDDYYNDESSDVILPSVPPGGARSGGGEARLRWRRGRRRA